MASSLRRKHFIFEYMASSVLKSPLQIKYKQLLCVVLLFVVFVSRAQQFSEKAILDSVSKTGFYNIAVTPELSSYIKTDFSDFRIANDKNQYQPYIISTVKKFFNSNNYTALEILKNETADSGRSILILKNTQAKQISSIALKIRNAAVSRNATISGSDNGQKWFTIKEDITLTKESSNDKDYFIQTLSFPGSSYYYYKLVIENAKNDPLNILEAGYFTNMEYKNINVYIDNPLPVFAQIDSSDHYSYISVEQPLPYHIERISIHVSGPPFFKRDIELIKQDGAVSSFQISSDSIFYFYVPVFNSKKFLLRIYNGDNPPLHISSVITVQEGRNIITYLEAGKQYTLLMHDSTATMPVYDLQHFKDSIIIRAEPLKILSFETVNANNKDAGSLWTNKLLWIIIIAAVIVLGLFTLRLTKEVQQKHSQ